MRITVMPQGDLDIETVYKHEFSALRILRKELSFVERFAARPSPAN